MVWKGNLLIPPLKYYLRVKIIALVNKVNEDEKENKKKGKKHTYTWRKKKDANFLVNFFLFVNLWSEILRVVGGEGVLEIFLSFLRKVAFWKLGEGGGVRKCRKKFCSTDEWFNCKGVD